jgi:AcrR family transcriptional regulator
MTPDTKQRILDTAVRLIGAQGYAATSLRQIIAEAGVNLAAVHYHFGSKQELVDEMVLRRARPVNEARLAALDRLEAEAAGKPLAVEKILEAFLLPMVPVADGDPAFVKVMGRLVTEGVLMSIVQRHFQPVISRTFAALRKALPDLPQDEFLWRTHFMIGAVAHTMSGGLDPSNVAAGADFSSRIPRLIAFLAGGFQAPPSAVSAAEKTARPASIPRGARVYGSTSSRGGNSPRAGGVGPAEVLRKGGKAGNQEK